MLTCRTEPQIEVEREVGHRGESRAGLPGNDFGCAGHRHSRWCGGRCGAGVGRSGTACAERALARFGLIEAAPPVFTGCARAPLAGLLLGLPALAGTGLLETAHTVYGELPNGFYSLDTMLCESVFRALLG